MADEESVKTLSLGDILANAIGERGCPICAILEDKTRDVLCQLQYDAVHNEEVKESIITAGGYCHFHFWYLHKLASPVANAQVLENLLERIRINFPDYRNSAPDQLVPDVHCPVCSSCGTWEKELLVVFAVKVTETDFWALYYGSQGLCLPHLLKALCLISDAKIRTSLMAAAARQLDLLVRELRLQVAKWRNNDRSPGEDQDSTYRAIEKLVCGRNYRIGLGSDK